MRFPIGTSIIRPILIAIRESTRVSPIQSSRFEVSTLAPLNRLRAGLLFAGITVVAVTYGYFAARGYLAFALSAHQQRTSLDRAVALEPRDADPYNALCRYLRDVEADPAGAQKYCERSVQLNQYEAAYWLDLAQTSYEAGNTAQQRRALEQAIAVDPKTPKVAWSAANFYLLQGQVDPAVNLFASVLKGDPGLVPLTLKSSWKILGQVDPILRMLPPDPAVYLQFIALLCSENQPAGAKQVWSRMVGLGAPVNYRDALFYVDQLLAWQDVEGAEKAWEQIGEHSTNFADYQKRKDNLAVNGSFENEVLNGGFDWRINPRGSTIKIDGEVAKQGHHSLEVTYSAPVLDPGLTQFVPVDPDASYTASAWIKTQELQTANGPRLGAFDAYSGTKLAASQETSYTTDWRQVELQFRTGPETKLVALKLTRDRQDTVIRGQLWIDSVEMRKRDEADRQ
jgi:tetratricopeptide (TPR) repeat protein